MSFILHLLLCLHSSLENSALYCSSCLMHHPPHTKLTHVQTRAQLLATTWRKSTGKPGGISRSTLWWRHTHTFACRLPCYFWSQSTCDFSILIWQNTLHMATYISNMLTRNCISVSLMCQCGKNTEADREENGAERVSNVTEMNWNCHCSNLRLDLESKRWWAGHVTKATKSWNGDHLIVPIVPLMENRQ